MYIIHGTWIPEETTRFINEGDFYIWVETDQKRPRSRLKGLHTGHLPKGKLLSFLSDELRINPALLRQIERNEERRYFVLPTHEDLPLDSFQLLRYHGEAVPSRFEWKSWGVNCIRLDDPLHSLKEIHFLSLHCADKIILGSDLLFWHQYIREYKDIIIKDQYIPALKCRSAGPASRKRKSKKIDMYELCAGWEIISARYEQLIDDYSSIMPLICTAGQTEKKEQLTFFEPKLLLRHFSEQMLERIIANTDFSRKIQNQVADTFIEECLYLYGSGDALLLDNDDLLGIWKSWYSWKMHLDGFQRKSLFSVCFRLESADPNNPDDWKIQFLAESRKDPSLKLELSRYWKSSKASRAYDFVQGDFDKELLLSLGHAARIYPKIWEGMETDKPAEVLLSLDEAFAFLKDSAWVLENAGYKIIVPSWWTPEGRKRIKIRLKTSSPSQAPAQDLNQGYFSLPALIKYQYELAIGGETLTEKEWGMLVNAKTPLVHFRGEWIELDQKRMTALLDSWKKNEQEQSEISFMDLLKRSSENEDDFEFSYDETLTEIMDRLLTKSKLDLINSLKSFNGSLRSYQQRGTSWLHYLENLGLNPCLADDMGLGKTIEVIALLLYERQIADIKNPTLLIVPTSVIGNWKKEIERFAPGLSVAIHHGKDRIKTTDEFQSELFEYDVVITSFALARKDEALLKGISWHRVVVDEAQNIKNPKSAQTKAINRLAARHRIALTGTPIENRLLDLWSIFNFLNPGYLYNANKFRKQYEIPIQKENDIDRSMTLKKMVAPFILRRLKTDREIIKDLPEKVEQKIYCNLTREQGSLYQAVVDEVSRAIEEKEGMQRRGLILSTLVKLKQICNHPNQFLQDGSPFTSDRSHKLSRLSEMIDEVMQSEESLLIFSQFKETGEALQAFIKEQCHFNTYFLHGGTPRKKREQMITEFQDTDTEPSVFLLSLKAGGVGITLTKANHVFHFDRWWNPAVENQATDRAFRIGQKKNVFVHKFISIGTLEEKIDQMLEDKRKLSDTIISSDESWLSELDNETFRNLIQLSRNTVLE